MYNTPFDFDKDGKLDAGEQALEYMIFRTVSDADDDMEYEDQEVDDI